MNERYPDCRPGSKVSFYFDGRFRHTALNDDSEIDILDIIVDSEEKEALVGVATPRPSPGR